MLRTMTMTTLAGLIAASFSLGANATEQTQRNIEQQQKHEQERQHHKKRGEEQYGARHNTSYRDGEQGENAEKISRVLENDVRYSRFQEVWEASGIENELNDYSNYTVFVPVNDAFERMPRAVQQMVERRDESELRDFVRNHIVEDELTVERFDDRDDRRTLAGHEVRLGTTQGVMTVNEVNVVEANVESGDNIIVHEVDSLIMDESAYASN